MNKRNVLYAVIMLVFISSISAADGGDTTFDLSRIEKRVKELTTNFRSPRRENEAMVESVKLALIAAKQRNTLIEQNDRLIKLFGLLVETKKSGK